MEIDDLDIENRECPVSHSSNFQDFFSNAPWEMNEESTSPKLLDEFFKVDILSQNLFKSPKNQEPSASIENSPETSYPVIDQYERRLKTADYYEECKNFMEQPQKDNILYPNFEYFKQKLCKENNIPNFEMFLKTSLQNELESIAREEVMTGVACNYQKEEMKNQNNKPIKIVKRCESPDIFADIEDIECSVNKLVDNFQKIGDSSKSFTDEGICSNMANEDGEISERRKELIKKVENLMKKFLEDLVGEKSVEFFIRDTKNWSNFSVVNEVLSLNPTTSSTEKKISLNDLRTSNRYTIILYLLAEIYHFLLTGTTCTIRELYYRDPDLVIDQIQITAAVRDICTLIDAAPWELGILSTSKGLIAGNLQITLANDEILDCSTSPGGILLPHNTTGIQNLETSAKYVILVEKDTVYEQLIQKNIFEVLGDIILVTGKGYPDISTRIIIKKIWDQFKIPIYCLVDADPFGIEIFLTYKFGSRAMANNSDCLACPHIRWIGVHPSEIELLDIPFSPLTARDKKKITELLKRPYLNDTLMDELLIMQRRNQKAEIEAITTISLNFLSRSYIPNKIRRNLDI